MVAGATTAMAQVQGPSTTRGPEYLPSAAGVVTVSIASNGNGNGIFTNELYTRLSSGAVDYRLVGLPDGMGIFRDATDLQGGTFSALVNHEGGNTTGIVRAHGSRGSFVSLWRIKADASDLRVIGADDLATTIKLWNTGTNAYETYDSSRPMPTYANNVIADYSTPDPSRNGLSRLCSADLAEPSAFRFGGLGTDARILLNGEEAGPAGRAFAFIASGPETGTAYELPEHGDYSWENNLACPFPQAKTVCIGTDDATPGNVYIYVGNKQATGNEVEKAGLVNGQLFAIVIDGVTINGGGQSIEDRAFVLGNAANGRRESAPFRTIEITDAKNRTGAYLQGLDAQGQMNFARPEDGAWDPLAKDRFYFVTTDAFSGNSRIWVMTFNDIANPQNGGTVTMLGDGSNPASFAGGIISANGLTDVRMMDNICMTKNGLVVIQEDVGNQARLGRMWSYDTKTDTIREIAGASSNLYLTGAPNFLTQDEEASGVVDARDILGPGWFVLNNQSHFSIPGELIEGGQLLALFDPAAVQLCPADFNADGFLDLFDYAAYVGAFETGTAGSDFNADGFLDFFDYSDFVAAFELGC